MAGQKIVPGLTDKFNKLKNDNNTSFFKIEGVVTINIRMNLKKLIFVVISWNSATFCVCKELFLSVYIF